MCCFRPYESVPTADREEFAVDEPLLILVSVFEHCTCLAMLHVQVRRTPKAALGQV